MWRFHESEIYTTTTILLYFPGNTIQPIPAPAIFPFKVPKLEVQSFVPVNYLQRLNNLHETMQELAAVVSRPPSLIFAARDFAVFEPEPKENPTYSITSGAWVVEGKMTECSHKYCPTREHMEVSIRTTSCNSRSTI